MPEDVRLTDKQAKAVLASWPTATGVWGGGTWLRAQPVAGAGGATGPRLQAVGARRLKTQPDGLWLMVPAPGAVDVIAVEVCGTLQNLYDKRSRYFPTGASLVVTLPEAWLDGEVAGRGRSTKPRREIMSDGDVDTLGGALAVRHLRVLFALPNKLLENLRDDALPAPHEFFTQHGSLRSHTSQAMQAFLRRMTVAAHFYP